MYFEYLFVCFVQIMAELKSNGVNIYHFPTDDQTVADTNNAMNVSTVIEKHKHIVVSFVCPSVSICNHVLHLKKRLSKLNENSHIKFTGSELAHTLLKVLFRDMC